MGIGAGEFVALAIVALIVLGPEKLPRYAAEAARMLRQVRAMANDARAEVRRELGPELDEFTSLGDLNPRSMVKKHLLEPVDLDSLDDAPRQKPADRRGPGSPPTQGSGPPRFDSDAT